MNDISLYDLCMKSPQIEYPICARKERFCWSI